MNTKQHVKSTQPSIGTLNIQIKVTEELITHARIWEKQNGHNYKDFVADLVSDYVLNGHGSALYDVQLSTLN